MSLSKSHTKQAIIAGALSVTMLLSACSWIEPVEGGDQVKVVTLPEVLKCERLGSVNTSVLAKVGFIERDADAVMADSIALAKNEAVRMGGNRLIAAQTLKNGHMRFDVYQCPTK